MGNDSVVICDQCDSSYYKVDDSECGVLTHNLTVFHSHLYKGLEQYLIVKYRSVHYKYPDFFK